MKINTVQLNKELRNGMIKNIRALLTPEEFAQVEFDPVKPEWKAPESIQKKIVDGLKSE